MEMKEEMYDSNNLGIGFQELCNFVINKKNCIFCGACVSLCPRIGIEENKPTLLEYDPECSMCASYCARTFFPEKEFTNRIFGNKTQKDFLIGHYQKITVAKSNYPDVIDVAQNGGVVSSLLIYALDTGFIDGVLLTDKDEDWSPKPVIATTPEEILDFAGSKYTITPTLITYKDAVEKYKLKRLAFVSLPCQIQAARKLQLNPPLSDKFGKIELIIGLYCLSNYSHESLKNMLRVKFNISMNEVRKFDISQGKFIVYTNEGQIKKIPIKETKDYKWPSCYYCKDHTAEFADISVGRVGAPSNDWNSVIVRTDIGLKLFNEAVEAKKLITADTVDITKIKKNSIIKRSQIIPIDGKLLSVMELLGVTEIEIRTYATLISLGESNVSLLSKVMKTGENYILDVLNALIKRGWITSTDGIYTSVNPNNVIKRDIIKLKRDFAEKINTLESEVLMKLKTLYAQNNFKHVSYNEFLDLI